MSDESNKSEEPTGKRLDEAFAEGNFAKSPDIQVVFVLLAAFTTLLIVAKEETRSVVEITEKVLSGLARYPIRSDVVPEWIKAGVITMVGLVLPFSGACALAGTLAGGLQSRFRLTPKALEFKISRLNPLNGFKRIFSMQGTMKVLIDGTKLIVIGWIIFGVVKKIFLDPIFYTPVDVFRLSGFMMESVTMLLGRLILALGVIAALNYMYQMKSVHKKLMMSKQEVQDESRSSEGDPKVKAAQRQMARRMMQQQMLKAVPTADVVVTNPTHFAVALKYERGRDKAPMVLAKGERLFAARIKELARENEVPMVENRPVARMLFKYGKVGQPIPSELYQAVAEILAFVYKTHRYYFHRLKERRAMN